MSDFATALENIGNGNVFLTTQPAVADFTSNRPVSIVLRTEWNGMVVELPSDPESLKLQCGNLSHYLMGQRVIIGWNLKNFFAYTLAKTDVPFVLEGTLMDLQVLEWYLGIEKQCPESYDEAKERLGFVCKHPSWKDLKKIAFRIYNPLISRIIPEIEAVGVVHQKLRRKLHAYYEIAGQANGRMKCSKGYSAGFNPHTTSAEERALLRPPFFDHVFMYLDFRSMEVSTLQWLSGDAALGQALESGSDLYEAIWKILTGMECNDHYRLICKVMFLPVVYGMGADALAEKIHVSVDTARKLIGKINDKFATAMNWVKSQQDSIGEDGICRDVYGRCREFSDNKYKARNFCVQSPAALLCLDKLVELKKDIGDWAKVLFHIHDGYVLSCHRNDKSRVKDIAVKSLERESDLFKGLQLKVSCQVGINFEDIE